jgi:branched-chain amino acid transport system substrate-binding protein
MHRNRRQALAAVAISVGLLVAGCGSSDGGGSTTSGSDGGSASGQKSDIVIGTIGSYSSEAGGTIAAGRDVLVAWVKMINDTGGIDGHPVKLVVKDDGGDPAKALNLAKALVTRDKAAAIVGPSSFADTVWAKYVDAQGVPVLGGSPYSPQFVTDPNFYAIGTNNAAQNYAVLAEAKKVGPKFANLYCAEAPVCAIANSYLEKFAPGLGVDMVVGQKVSASQPNFTAVCKAIKDAGANALSIAETSQVGIKISEECRDLGAKFENVATGGQADSAWLEHPRLDGSLNIELTAPFFDDSTPGQKAYREFLAKYVPNIGSRDGAEPEYTYISGQLLKAAVEAAPADEITPDTIKKGLYSLKNETLDGLTAPLNYKEGQPNLINCWFTSKIQDGKWTAPDGAKYECAPDDVVNSVIAEVAKG